MTRWSMLLCSASVGLAACGGLSGQATLETDRSNYVPGEELTLRLHNGAAQSLGYNLCGATLQRRTETAWEQVPVKSDGFCQAILLSLAPWSDESVRQTLDEALPVGEYRYLTHVEWDGEREEVASKPFGVGQYTAP